MFCNYCKSARPENEAPCPNCGAPSSLLGNFQGGSQGAAEPVSTAWSASAAPTFNKQWNNQGPQFTFDVPNPSFDGQSVQQNLDFQKQPSPEQTWNFSAQAYEQQQPQGQQSLLPVPYTGNGQENNQQTPMQLMPFQQQMLPALPDEYAETVYVPPMYTKPRPIIPRYRAISGLLSVIIVSLLLCGGGAYYANSSGKLTGITQLLGMAPLTNVDAGPGKTIPDPPNPSIVPGKAKDIIMSATTTAHLVGNNGIASEQDLIFPVNAQFFVTFSAKPPKVGKVLIKWYMNGNHYTDTTSPKDITPKDGTIDYGHISMTYAIPAAGIAELYWVGQGQVPQLAQTLYFSVR